MTSPRERAVHILEAGLDVILRFGFRKTTLDDIATAAGVSRATVYNYFPSKDAVCREIISWYIEGMRAVQAAAVDPAAPPDVRILASVEALWRALTPLRDRYRLLLGPARDLLSVGSDLIEAYEGEQHAFLAAMIREAVDTGRFRPVDVDALALALGAAIRGLTEAWVFQPEQSDLPQGARVLLSATFAGLRAPGIE